MEQLERFNATEQIAATRATDGYDEMSAANETGMQRVPTKLPTAAQQAYLLYS
jgi:hypothetical protein